MATPNLILEILRYFIFPGLIFTIFFAFFVQWIDRKFYASAQQRIGPPISQPFWDFIKLLIKRDDKPIGISNELLFLPPLLFLLTFYITFFIPIVNLHFVGITFPGDLFFLVFLITIHGGLIFLIGWSSKSPYTFAGSVRAILIEISVIIPLVLCLISVAIITGSYQLIKVSELFWIRIFEQPLYLIAIVPLFLILIFISTALLERPPFDQGHAETELIMGWQTELRGKSLALVSLSSDIYTWALAGIYATIFLSPQEFWINLKPLIMLEVDITPIISAVSNTILFISKVTVIIIGISLVRTTQARLRIDQAVKYLWGVFLPITLLLFSIVLVIGGH